MLPSRPSSATITNVFGEVWIAHRSLGFVGTNFKGQTPGFHTPEFVQGLEANLDEHRRTATMFQHATKYNIQMTNILFRLFELEIKNKKIIEEKDIFIQNMQGVLEEQKLKV